MLWNRLYGLLEADGNRRRNRRGDTTCNRTPGTGVQSSGPRTAGRRCSAVGRAVAWVGDGGHETTADAKKSARGRPEQPLTHTDVPLHCQVWGVGEPCLSAGRVG